MFMIISNKSYSIYLVYRIPPFYYLHVLDQNTNVTRLEVGPKTFVKQDHEKVILGPERMLIIPYVLKSFFQFLGISRVFV